MRLTTSPGRAVERCAASACHLPGRTAPAGRSRGRCAADRWPADAISKCDSDHGLLSRPVLRSATAARVGERVSRHLPPHRLPPLHSPPCGCRLITESLASRGALGMFGGRQRVGPSRGRPSTPLERSGPGETTACRKGREWRIRYMQASSEFADRHVRPIRHRYADDRALACDLSGAEVRRCRDEEFGFLTTLLERASSANFRPDLGAVRENTSSSSFGGDT